MASSSHDSETSSTDCWDAEHDALIEEVRRAYPRGEGQEHLDEYPLDGRCLSFLTSGWFTDGQALAGALTRIGSYNRFDAQRVARRTRDVSDEAEHIRVAVGREGSPVLYIETDVPETALGKFNDYADECWVIDRPVGNARQMIDRDPDFDPHTMCNHDEPIVPAEEYAEADDKHPVVRCWWD